MEEGRKERGREGDREEEEAISKKQLMGVPEAVRVGEGESKGEGRVQEHTMQKERNGWVYCVHRLCCIRPSHAGDPRAPGTSWGPHVLSGHTEEGCEQCRRGEAG